MATGANGGSWIYLLKTCLFSLACGVTAWSGTPDLTRMALHDDENVSYCERRQQGLMSACTLRSNPNGKICLFFLNNKIQCGFTKAKMESIVAGPCFISCPHYECRPLCQVAEINTKR